MVTDMKYHQANQTDREIGMYRSAVRAFTGNGSASRLHEDQVPSFAHRVRMYAHLRGMSFAAIADEIGLGPVPKAQVLAALESE